MGSHSAVRKRKCSEVILQVQVMSVVIMSLILQMTCGMCVNGLTSSTSSNMNSILSTGDSFQVCSVEGKTFFSFLNGYLAKNHLDYNSIGFQLATIALKGFRPTTASSLSLLYGYQVSPW